MTIVIPNDEAIGQQLRAIAQAVGFIAVAFYIAGHTLGAAIHWFSANLTHLPAYAIDQLTTDHASAHSSVRHSNGDHRPSARRSRQPKPQSNHSGVGFA